MENFNPDEFLTDEEKEKLEKQYQSDYMARFNEIAAGAGLDEKARQALLDEMIASGTLFNSRHPRPGLADAEINVRRFLEHRRNREHSKHDIHAKGLLDHVERTDGKKARKALEKSLDEPVPAYLDEDL
jgi:hypothetical protein